MAENRDNGRAAVPDLSAPPRTWRARFTAMLVAGLLALAGVASGASPAAAADATSNAPIVALMTTKSGAGYWQVAADGGVFSFGDAVFHGSAGGIRLNQPIVGAARTPSGNGYWLVASDGGVFAYGDARSFGSAANLALEQPVVGMAPTPSGQGYWLVAADGGVFSYGDARFFGAAANLVLNKPVVGMAATPSGAGYWLVASDGGIFAYGDARFFGSTGSMTLNKPVVGMAATPSGLGYWLVAADGGIFAYGDARFFGSAGSLTLAQPVGAMTVTPSAGGYWLVASDGGVFAYGDARFFGRAAYTPPAPRGYSLVLPRTSVSIASLTGKHHDYPAVDIPVPSGTPFYAVTSGTVSAFFQANGCGNGITLQGDDGATYTYCHATSTSAAGRVVNGQLLGKSGNTGHSTGPHLHVQIKYPTSTLRCPQNLMAALYNGAPPPRVGDLPTGGCFTS